jgi:hypothetical protein
VCCSLTTRGTIGVMRSIAAPLNNGSSSQSLNVVTCESVCKLPCQLTLSKGSGLCSVVHGSTVHVGAQLIHWLGHGWSNIGKLCSLNTASDDAVTLACHHNATIWRVLLGPTVPAVTNFNQCNGVLSSSSHTMCVVCPCHVT